MLPCKAQTMLQKLLVMRSGVKHRLYEASFRMTAQSPGAFRLQMRQELPPADHGKHVVMAKDRRLKIDIWRVQFLKKPCDRRTAEEVKMFQRLELFKEPVLFCDHLG